VLSDYAGSDAVAEITADGRIVAEEQHYQFRITVGRDYRRLDIIRGYQNTIVRSKTYSNTKEAYEAFLKAQDKAGFTRQRKLAVETDETGQCPTGYRYIVDLRSGADQILRSWTTSCDTGSGTFGGNLGLVRQLFREQIPDYDSMTSDISI
jgi:hypothetical protein